MLRGAFHEAFCNQDPDQGFDLDDLSFALIQEGSAGQGVSEESFRDLLTLFEMPAVLRASDFHSLTTAVWTDRDVFSAKQLKDMERKLAELDFSEVESENSYSLCDMVVNVLEPVRARRLLIEIGAQAALKDATEYCLRQIDRRQV